MTKICECGKELKRVKKNKCLSCQRQPKFKGNKEDPNIIIDNKYIIDTKDIKAYFLNSEIQISGKRKIDISCIQCSNKYSTHMGGEKRKKNKFTCQSCAISNEWKNNEYKEKHVEAIVKTKSTKESKKKHSKAQIKKWKNKDCRNKMLTSLKKVWASEPYRKKLSESLKKRWLENPPACYSKKFIIKSNKGEVILRSSYERDFVRYLDDLNISWEYEPKRFVLKTYKDRALIPDFYLPEFDLWVEIKGYFWHDAKEKWEAFCKEYSNLDKIILFGDDLKQLINKEKIIENYIEKKNRQEACI